MICNILPFRIIFPFILISNIIKISDIIFRCSNSFVLHNFEILVQYGYDVLVSKVFDLLLSLILSAIFLISSVYTLCVSLLNLCCNAKMLLKMLRSFIVQ